jgi:signal transduction histidine kinase
VESLLSNPSYLIPPLAAGIFTFLLLGFAFPRARESPAHRFFSLFLLTLGLWAILIFMMRSRPDTVGALPWDRAAVALMLVSAFVFFNFTLAYTRQERKRWVSPAGLLYLLLIAALAPTPLMTHHMELKSYGYAPIFGIPFYPLALAAYTWIGMGVYNMLRAYWRSTVYEDRNRLLYITIATLFPVIGTLFDLFPTFYPMSILGNLAFSILTTIAIRRYRLLDIQMALRRGLAYLIMSALVALPYVGLIFFFTRVLAVGEIQPLLYLVLLLILAFSLQPLWSQIQRLVDRWFYRERYDYFKALEDFGQRTRTITQLDKLASEMSNLMVSAMRASRVCFLLPSERGDFVPVASTGLEGKGNPVIDRDSPLLLWLMRNEGYLEYRSFDLIPQLQVLTPMEKKVLRELGQLFIPLKVRGKLSGLLVLGPKLSESPYGGEDIRLLSMIANQTAVIMDDARLYALEKARVEELQRLDEMKSEFLQVVAHQLKTPITSIKAATGMLSEVKGESSMRERLLSSIVRGAESLEKLVTDILEFGKMKSGVIELRRQPTDLGQLIRDVATLVSPAIKRKEQALELDLPPSGPVAVIDGQRLEQALLNLLANANTYTSEGGHIAVRLRTDGTSVRVQVEDNGPGIPEEDQEKVFEPYHHIRENSGQLRGGTGLGLAIARSLVELHGGRLWVQSTPGQGSTFILTLPLQPTNQHQTE